MPSARDTLDAEGLARHGRALRRLARALVHDEDLAQDLVQDTWLASLRSPPDPRRPLRPWLSEVLRNLVRAGHRARGRRERREQEFTASSAGDSSSAESALASAQLLRLVADLVLGLEEPLRTTVILRYVEARSAVDIARAQGVPAATVRSRARDGLEQIRAELDRRHGGDRAGWRFALFPLAEAAGLPRPAHPPSPVVAGLAAKVSGAKLVTAAVLAVALAAAIAVRTSQKPRGDNPTLAVTGPATRGRPGPLPGPLLRAGAPASIQGLVRSPSGGAIAGARVVLVPSDRGLTSERVRAVESTRDGYSLNGLPPGSYTLSATAPGFATAQRGLFLRPGIDARGMDVTLSPGGLVLTGRVLDSSRVPLAGAVVQAARKDRLHTVTDSSGGFSLALAEGSYRLTAAAAGFASGKQMIALGSDASTEFFLDPGATVQGRVVLRGSERPVPDVSLVLLDARLGFAESPHATSDSDGRFEFRDLPAATYELIGHRETTARSVRPLAVAAAARIFQPVELEPGNTVSGRITGDGGRPLAGAYVGLGRPRTAGVWINAYTGPDGRYQLSGVPPGSWWVAARADGYLSGQGAAVYADARTDLVLQRGTVIDGRVVDQAGRPVPGAWVKAVDDRNVQRGSVRTASDGSFRLTDMVTGQLELEAIREDGVDAGELRIQLGPAGMTGVLLRLDRSAAAAGRVRWDDGAPASGVIVAARRENGMLVHRSTRTDAAGRFEIAGLAWGRWILEARLSALQTGSPGAFTDNPGRRTIDVGRGQKAQDIELVLARLDGEVSGTVFDAQGNPVSGAVVSASPTDASGRPVRDNGAITAEAEKRYEVTSGPDGAFSIQQLPRGPMRLTATHPTLGARTVTRVWTGARDLRVDLSR